MQTILQSHRQQIVAGWEDCRTLLIHLYQKFLTGLWPTGFHSTKKKKKTKVLTVKGKRLSTKINNNPEITCNGSLLTNVMNVKLLGLEIGEELYYSCL